MRQPGALRENHETHQEAHDPDYAPDGVNRALPSGCKYQSASGKRRVWGSTELSDPRKWFKTDVEVAAYTVTIPVVFLAFRVIIIIARGCRGSLGVGR